MSRLRLTSSRGRILDACLLAAIVATLWHVAAASPAPEPRPPKGEPLGPMLDAGVRVPIPELWENTSLQRTAILIMDVACPACMLSRPFYRDLDRLVGETPGTRLVILSENPIPIVRTWLEEGGIGGRIVRIPSRRAFGIMATPTLLLADREGVVTDISIGILNRADSDRLNARLRGDTRTQPLRLPYSFSEVSVSARPGLESAIGSQLVDTRDRVQFAKEHSPAAVNIPDDELEVRAAAELRQSLAVFIDCRYADPAECRLAGLRLGRQGFSTITSVLR